MPILNRRLDLTLRYFLLFCSTTLILYVSLMPITRVKADFSPEIQTYDLPFHLVVYFVLTSLMIGAIARRETRKRDRINLFLISSLFGGILEILQAVLPNVNRSCTISDFLFNTTGAALAAIVFPVSRLLFRTKR